MNKGEHLRVNRGTYYHHGIYVGDGYVIHFSGELLNKLNATILKTTITEFTNNDTLEIVIHKNCMPVSWTIETAHSCLGQQNYNLIFNNCEHFASYCKTGDKSSLQVKDATISVVSGSIVNNIAKLVGLPLPILVASYGFKKIIGWFRG